MKVAIHQPNYLPWCGFFAKMNACDTFIILDDAPISNGRTVVSRTRIRSGDAERWLSVPTSIRGMPPIRDVEFADVSWPAKHLATLRHTYARAPNFDEVFALLEPIYADSGTRLGQFNQRLLAAVASYLGIKKNIVLSSSLEVQSSSDDRLIDLVQRVGGSTYVSGAGGSKYQDPAKFVQAGLELEVRTYQPIPYDAPRFPFIPGLSIVDALFTRGSSALELLDYPSQL